MGETFTILERSQEKDFSSSRGQMGVTSGFCSGDAIIRIEAVIHASLKVFPMSLDGETVGRSSKVNPREFHILE